MAYDGRIRLDLRPVSSLLPHEETIETSTREMIAQLKVDGVQKDPVIVDATTHVILDGMHRLSAFKFLGIDYIVCSPVDYHSKEIRLERWLRIYGPTDGAGATLMMKELGMTAKCPPSEALSRLDRLEASAAAFASGLAFFRPGDHSLEEGFATLKAADELAGRSGLRRSFASEEELTQRATSRSEVALLVARFRKEDVLRAGLEKRLFPCKTSMHIVDPRPVGVNIPLVELENGSRKTVAERLSAGPFEVLPPNSSYEGRRYRERLLLLSAR